MDLNSNVFLQSFSQKIRPTACTCACPSNDGHKIKENISCPGEFPSLAEISEAYWPHQSPDIHVWVFKEKEKDEPGMMQQDVNWAMKSEILHEGDNMEDNLAMRNV